MKRNKQDKDSSRRHMNTRRSHHRHGSLDNFANSGLSRTMLWPRCSRKFRPCDPRREWRGRWSFLVIGGCTGARKPFFFNRGVKVKHQLFLCHMTRWFSPHPLKSCWLLMQH